MSAPPAIEAVAGVAQRLAVLLTAGVPPPAAWRYLDESSPAGDAGVVVARAADAAANGDDVGRAIVAASVAPGTSDAWAALAAGWSVAIDVGAPLAANLLDMAAAFRSMGRLERDRRIALAGPRATAGLVALLPVVAILFGSLLGFDTVGTLFGTPAGLACVGLGCALMLGGHRWSSALVRRAGRATAMPGLALDLAAIALSGGVSVRVAREIALGAAERLGAAEGPAGPDDTARIDAVLSLSQRAGVPAAALLRADAEQLRLDARTAGQERAARLGVTLMIPLGVCVLPAFMLLGVAPLLLSVVSSTTLIL